MLQHTANHFTEPLYTLKTWQTATYYNTLQHAAPRCTTLQHTGTDLEPPYALKTWRFTTHCNTLQQTATRCNTLQQIRSPHTLSRLDYHQQFYRNKNKNAKGNTKIPPESEFWHPVLPGKISQKSAPQSFSTVNWVASWLLRFFAFYLIQNMNTYNQCHLIEIAEVNYMIICKCKSLTFPELLPHTHPESEYLHQQRVDWVWCCSFRKQWFGWVCV